MAEQASRSRFEFDSGVSKDTLLHTRAGEAVREFASHSPSPRKPVTSLKRRLMLFTAIALAFQSVSRAWDGEQSETSPLIATFSSHQAHAAALPATPGMTLIAQQRYPEAEAWFVEARSHQPRNVPLLLGHARAMMHCGHVASAGALLDLAVQLEPANVEAICTRAKWHARQDPRIAVAQLRDCPAATDPRVLQLRRELSLRIPAE